MIQGSSSVNRATLDANSLSSIFTISNTSSVTFKNIIFINSNSNLSNGSAINSKGKITIEDCTFTNNRGTSGATVLLESSAKDSVIKNSEFLNNYGVYSQAEGGAIASYANNTRIEDCYFLSNTAVNGGAINFFNSSGNQILNSVFRNNKANSYGGAIYLNSTNLTIANCEFKYNVAINGSAVYNLNSNLTLTCSTFNDNLANTFDIVAPPSTAYKPSDAAIAISLLVGDNILMLFTVKMEMLRLTVWFL